LSLSNDGFEVEVFVENPSTHQPPPRKAMIQTMAIENPTKNFFHVIDAKRLLFCDADCSVELEVSINILSKEDGEDIFVGLWI